MNDWNEDQLPDELSDVAERLRRNRAEMNPLEDDSMKLRIKAQASRSAPSAWRPRRGTPMKSRVVTLALTALVIGGTTAGGIAASGGNGNGSSADSQYRPGLGCGDKNHIHTGPPGNPDKTCKN
jgi:hypothetical protein